MIYKIIFENKVNIDEFLIKEPLKSPCYKIGNDVFSILQESDGEVVLDKVALLIRNNGDICKYSNFTYDGWNKLLSDFTKYKEHFVYDAFSKSLV